MPECYHSGELGKVVYDIWHVYAPSASTWTVGAEAENHYVLIAHETETLSPRLKRIIFRDHAARRPYMKQISGDNWEFLCDNVKHILTYFTFIIDIMYHLLFPIAHDNDSIPIYNKIKLGSNKLMKYLTIYIRGFLIYLIFLIAPICKSTYLNRY